MTILPASTRRSFRRGPFQIHRVQPGLAWGDRSSDTGIAGLGCFDHAHLDTGLVVAMHQHRNDEIVSYLRNGTMVHEDSDGVRALLSPTHLMGMNAGIGFWHEESVPVGQVDMLQIFIRPETDNLPSDLQFCDLLHPVSVGQWRLIAAPPVDNPPLFVRQRVRVLDTQLSIGASLNIPSEPSYDASFLYVFHGQITIDGHQLNSGDGASGLAHSAFATATSNTADLVMFQIDTRARFTRSGTLSG